MKRIFLSILLLISLVALCSGQDDYDSEPCVECSLDCIECGMWTTIVNQLDTLVIEEGTGDGQGAICTLAEHQITWYGFIAGSEELEFTITTDSCVGNVSVEVGVYSGIDCSNFDQESAECYGGQNGNAISEGETEILSMTDLIIGQYYWIIFDTAPNQNGNCWFTLTVTDGLTGAPPITEMPIVDGPPLLCDTESGTYNITNIVIGASEYEWYVDGVLESEGITYDFAPPGTGEYEICAKPISQCEEGPLSDPCFVVTVAESTTGVQDLSVCDGDCVDYEGNTFCNGGFADIIIPNQVGCDSMIDVTIYNIEFDIVLATGNECVTGQGVELFLTSIDQSYPTLDGSETSLWEWYLDGSPIPGSANMDLIYATESGDYSVILNVDYLGTNCEFENMITLDMNEFSFDFDPLFTYGDVCIGDIVDYELDYSPYDSGDFTVDWTVPDGALISNGQGSPIIEVAWIEGNGGDVCYIISNTCASSPEICFPVNIISSSPPDLMLSSDTVCINEDLIVSVLNLPNSYDSFEWQLNNANLTSGNITDPEDVVISFPTPGNQSISMTLDDGCNIYNIVAEIEVIENPTFPPLQCLIDGTMLIVDWTDIDEVLNYSIGPSTTPSNSTIMGSSLEISDLNPGDTVMVEIIAEGPCGSFNSMIISCEMPDCPAVDLSFTSSLPDTVCINNTIQVFQLEATDNLNNGGSGIFQGDGITDINSGTFDISQAGTGLHIVEYIYDLNNGDCISKVYDTIFIKTEPELFIEPIESICLSDTTQIYIEGFNIDLEINPFFESAAYFSNDSLGYYSVSFNTSGIQNETLEVTDKDCGSYFLDIEIDVQEAPPINLTCFNQSTNSISIVWDDSAYYSSYEISINGTSETTTSDSDFTISNLAVDSMISFSILPIVENGVCVPIPETISCFTIDCISAEVSIETMMDTIICLSSTDDNVVLTLDYDSSLFNGTETITWSGNGINDQGIFDVNQAPGDYPIMASLNADYCSYSDEITITIIAEPVLSLSALSEVCIADDWTLSFNGDIDSNFEYVWTSNATNSLTGLGPHVINFDQAGMFEFTLSASNGICSSEPFTQIVTVLDSVRTPDLECNPSTNSIEITWTLDNSECNGSIDLFLNGNLEATDVVTPFYNFENLTSDTPYTITVVNNSSCSCEDKEITINCSTLDCPEDLLGIMVASDTICLDGSLELLQLNPLYADQEIPHSQVTWSGTGISSQGEISLNNISAGEYEYTLSYPLDEQCIYTSSVILYFFEPADFDYTITSPLCPGTSSGTIEIISMEDPSMVFELQGTEILLNEVIILSPGNYNLDIISNGICSYTEEIVIPEAQPIDLQIIGPSNVSFGVNSTYTVELNPSGNLSEVTWLFNDSIISIPINQYVFPSNGTLCVELLYENECILTSCKQINVINPNVYIPNVISLNSSSSNSEFKIFCNDPGAMVELLSIYDRWGNLMFFVENQDIGNPSSSWNGWFKTKAVNPGVYVYRATLLYSNGEKEEFIGDFTLLN